MIRLTDILSIVKLGLENLDSFNDGNKKFNIKNLSVANEDTICCEFYSQHKNAMDIKVEMATIMGFFNGVFKDDTFEAAKFNWYAVRAFSGDGNELMYAISSKKTAETIGKGGSIDWLKSTIFQENTEDYRLAQSKNIIAEIENCLRELVKVKLHEEFGSEWWDKGLDNKLGREVKQVYSNQFGVDCNDGNILIAYTYTLQLKKIISTHFKLFKQYFGSLVDFDSQMDSLNKIRREEAHNRTISEANLSDLRELHEKLTSKALDELVDFQSGYLTDNWRLKIKKIMNEREYQGIYDEQSVMTERNPFVKLQKITQNTKHVIAYLEEITVKLKSIAAPVHKKLLQRDLIMAYEKFKDLQTELLNETGELDEAKIKNVIARIDEHKLFMNRFVEKFLLSES